MTDHELTQLRAQLAQLKREHAAELEHLRSELTEPEYGTEAVDALLAHIDAAPVFDAAFEDRLEVLYRAARASKQSPVSAVTTLAAARGATDLLSARLERMGKLANELRGGPHHLVALRIEQVLRGVP